MATLTWIRRSARPKKKAGNSNREDTDLLALGWEGATYILPYTKVTFKQYFIDVALEDDCTPEICQPEMIGITSEAL